MPLTKSKSKKAFSHNVEALEAVIQYLMQNERISYEEYLDENGTGEGHIYAHADTLNRYVNGLYSTGSIQK